MINNSRWKVPVWKTRRNFEKSKASGTGCPCPWGFMAGCREQTEPQEKQEKPVPSSYGNSRTQGWGNRTITYCGGNCKIGLNFKGKILDIQRVL